MSSVLSKEKNVLGGPLLACSYAPLTGFFRDGCCATHDVEGVAHLVCIKATAEFLEFSRSRGNDLSTPRPEMRFKGLEPGDRWCLHVLRWVEAHKAGMAPQVVLESTHENVLRYVPLGARQARGDAREAARRDRQARRRSQAIHATARPAGRPDARSDGSDAKAGARGLVRRVRHARFRAEGEGQGGDPRRHGPHEPYGAPPRRPAG